MSYGIVTLVAGKPGHLLDGLRTFLKAHPKLSVLLTANDIQTTYQMIREHHPRLVLLDYNLSGGDILDVIRSLKRDWASIRCIVIVEKAPQYHAALQAGADEVLLDGIYADQFFNSINRVLDDQVLAKQPIV